MVYLIIFRRQQTNDQKKKKTLLLNNIPKLYSNFLSNENETNHFVLDFLVKTIFAFGFLSIRLTDKHSIKQFIPNFEMVFRSPYLFDNY